MKSVNVSTRVCAMQVTVSAAAQQGVMRPEAASVEAAAFKMVENRSKASIVSQAHGW